MIGVDIEDINRFIDKDESFLNKIFTENELAYCNSYKKPESHLAVRFCAKEAVIKTLTGFGITNVYLRDIEVLLNENSVPYINLLKEIDKNIRFEVSLSHCKDKAIAMVTGYEK